MHRTKSPALIVGLELQAQCGLAVLVEKDPDALITADNGSDQHQPQLGLRGAWRRRRWRVRCRRRNHRWRRPPRSRKDRPFARVRQCCERDRPERIAPHRLARNGRRRSRHRIGSRCRRRGDIRKRSVRPRHDDAWHVDIREIRGQRKGWGGNGKQRRQHGREPHREPPYRPMSSHVPHHRAVTSQAQDSRLRKAEGLHMQDRRRLSSERRGKQGLSVTRVTAVRSGSRLADVSTVYCRQRRSAGCECINFVLGQGRRQPV